MKKEYKLGLFLLLGLILILPSVLSLLNSGFPLTDDGNWMVIRFSAFYEVLRDGQFPVRFLSRLNNGFGYPVADFLYPLFMYLATPLHVLGLNFQDSIKTLFAAGILSSFLFSFLWLRKIFSDLSSLVGAVIYTLFPYHLWDLYKRGSLGEIVSLAFVPFLLWQLERKSLILSSLGVSLVILSHNSLALFFIPLIFIYDLIRREDIRNTLKIFLLGFGLSAFFWIPALYDRQFVVFDKTLVSNYSSYFNQSSEILFAGIITFVVLFSYLIHFHKSDKTSKYFFFITLLSIFLVLPVSSFIWNINVFSTLVQFPFRILSVTLVSCVFLAAFVLEKTKSYKIFASVLFLTITLYSSTNFIKPESYQNYPDTFYSTNLDTTTVQNEYMPKWVGDTKLSYPEKKIEVINGDSNIENEIIRPNSISFTYEATRESSLKVNTVYFPGWRASVNGKETNINYQKDGLINLNLPSGRSEVVVKFGETNVRLFADFISLTSLLIIAYLILRVYKRNK